MVTNEGKIIYPDQLLMLFAKDVVSRNPGADIIFDVKCTRRLNNLIAGYGGRPIMWKTGHSLIKKKMKETGALLAGEMSGHIFFKERWFGFDDGTYAAARLLEILSRSADASAVLNALPSSHSTPELNVKCAEGEPHRLVAAMQEKVMSAAGPSQGAKAPSGGSAAHEVASVGAIFAAPAKVNTIDGVRVDWPDGFGLIRASNTTPVLVLRFEADTQEELERIQDVFRAQLLKVAPDLQLPF